MANEYETGGGLLARALLDIPTAAPRGGGLSALASVLPEPPNQQRRGLLSYASALESFTALPSISDVIQHAPADTGIVVWTGASGVKYRTELDLIGACYKSRSGVYIFCSRMSDGRWRPIYVGETSSFKRRLTDELERHHRWPSVAREGATHICTLHVPDGLAIREGIETDLRIHLDPPCNRQ